MEVAKLKPCWRVTKMFFFNTYCGVAGSEFCQDLSTKISSVPGIIIRERERERERLKIGKRSDIKRNRAR